MVDMSRKRTEASPLIRPTATPSHATQMQKIFQDAKSHLQMDLTFASSPLGSIASRLPSQDELVIPREQQSMPNESGNIDWRFSIAPERCAEFDVDVREPIVVDSPGLPTLPLSKVFDSNTQHEPISSGFTSPAAQEQPSADDYHRSLSTSGEHSRTPSVLRSREDSPCLYAKDNSRSCRSPSFSSEDEFMIESHGVPLSFPMRRTELERPMSRLSVSATDAWLSNILGDAQRTTEEPSRQLTPSRLTAGALKNKCPQQFQSQRAHSTSDELEQDDATIELSSPSPAATVSAKGKRSYGLRFRTLFEGSDANKENIPPWSTSLQPLSDYRMTPVTRFRTTSANIPFRRVNSRGSPLPMPKIPTEGTRETVHPSVRPDSKVVVGPTKHQTQREERPVLEKLREKQTRTPGKPKKTGAAKFYQKHLPNLSSITSVKRPRDSPSPIRPIFRSSPIRDGSSMYGYSEGKKLKKEGSQDHSLVKTRKGANDLGIRKESSLRIYEDMTKPSLEKADAAKEDGLWELSSNVDIIPRAK